MTFAYKGTSKGPTFCGAFLLGFTLRNMRYLRDDKQVMDNQKGLHGLVY